MMTWADNTVAEKNEQCEQQDFTVTINIPVHTPLLGQLSAKLVQGSRFKSCRRSDWQFETFQAGIRGSLVLRQSCCQAKFGSGRALSHRIPPARLRCLSEKRAEKMAA